MIFPRQSNWQVLVFRYGTPLNVFSPWGKKGRSAGSCDEPVNPSGVALGSAGCGTRCTGCLYGGNPRVPPRRSEAARRNGVLPSTAFSDPQSPASLQSVNAACHFTTDRVTLTDPALRSMQRGVVFFRIGRSRAWHRARRCLTRLLSSSPRFLPDKVPSCHALPNPLPYPRSSYAA